MAADLRKVDSKKEKATWLADIKAAVRKGATQKTKDGTPISLGWVFARGKDKNDHVFIMHPRKPAKTLMAELKKAHPDRKTLCWGTSCVVKEGGKFNLEIKYIKKLPGSERYIQEALKAMALPQLKVVLAPVRDDEEVADVEETEDSGETATADDSAEEVELGASSAGDDETEAASDDRQSAAAGVDEETKDEDEKEAAPSASAQPSAAPASGDAKAKALGEAPQVWQVTRSVMSKNIDQLRAAIKAEYANEAPELNSEIDKGVAQMNRIMEHLDHRLAEQLEKAHQAKDEAARRAELAKAKALLTEHIKYVQSEPLIAHIDSNPFGVQTDLKKTLLASFTHVAKVIT
jgi:molybdopterin biosynthesis enzyme MoaB